MNFSSKTVLVTGSTSGIGLGIIRKFASLGAKVILNSFTNTPEDHSLAEEIATRYKTQAVYQKADLRDPQEARNLVKKTPVIDILVNNAGIQFVSPVEDFPVEKWDEIIAVNLSSAFHTTAEAIPKMKVNGWGRIINISSCHGMRASPFKSAYVSAKHGLIGFTKTIALETAESAITCNAICPGYVLTPLVEQQIPDLMKVYNKDRESVIRDVVLARQPSKNFVTAEQIADAAVFLCSSAADQITGLSMPIDGGWTAL